MKSDFIDCMLECQKFGFSEEQKQEAMNSMKTRLMLSGKFPDYPNSEELIDENVLQSQKLTDELSQFISDDQLSGQLAISSSLIDFHFDLSITGGAVDYSLTGNATRHLIATWIKHLIVCAHGKSAASEKTQPEQEKSEQEKNEVAPATESAVSSVAVCIVKNTQSKTVSIKTEQFSVIEQQQACVYLTTLLDIFTRGLEHPLLIAPDLADKLMSGIQADPDFEPFSASADDYFHHPEIANRWSTFFDATNFPSPFVVDKYFTHYFPQYIEKDKETISDLLAIYQPLKKHMLAKNTVKSGAKSGTKTAKKGSF